MLINSRINNCRASVFFEYATLFAVVAAALFTMNMYVKRGIQARTKDLSDTYFSAGNADQVERVDPDVNVESRVDSESSMTAQMEMYAGGKGGTKITSSADDQSSVDSLTKAPRVPPDIYPFIPSDAGEVTMDPHPKDTYAEDDNFDELKKLAQETGDQNLLQLVDLINTKKGEWDKLVDPYIEDMPGPTVDDPQADSHELKLPRVASFRRFSDEELGGIWLLAKAFKKQEQDKLAVATEKKDINSANRKIKRADRFMARIVKEYTRRGLTPPADASVQF